VSFAPPAGEWWGAVETKIQTAHEISIATTRNLDPADFATTAEDLKHLSAAAEEAAETAEKHLKERLAALEKSFSEQEAHVADLAKPLAFLALDLDFVARRFPMLLGSALGVAFFWPAYRRLELARSFALLSQEKQTLSWADTIGFTPARKSLWFLVVAAGAWVALASWQLVESGLTASFEAGMWLTVKGLLPVVAGAVYANAVNRRTRVLISKINSQKCV
jgi:hypothetical protein